jgi:hypothetical protein
MALASAASSVERAAFQALANLSSDHIPVYEKILNLNAAPGASDEERRRAISLAWVLEIRADSPSMDQAVKAIDSHCTFEGIGDGYDSGNVTTITLGRTMGSRLDPSAYGNRLATAAPNYSGEFFGLVHYAPPAGIIEPPPLVYDALERLLNTSLPAWVDWIIHTGEGFFCDGGTDGTSLLDLKLL